MDRRDVEYFQRRYEEDLTRKRVEEKERWLREFHLRFPDTMLVYKSNGSPVMDKTTAGPSTAAAPQEPVSKPITKRKRDPSPGEDDDLELLREINASISKTRPVGIKKSIPTPKPITLKSGAVMGEERKPPCLRCEGSKVYHDHAAESRTRDRRGCFECTNGKMISPDKNAKRVAEVPKAHQEADALATTLTKTKAMAMSTEDAILELRRIMECQLAENGEKMERLVREVLAAVANVQAECRAQHNALTHTTADGEHRRE